jgi:hypothetical protein
MAVIPRASHLHHLEQPEIFKAVVGGFLDAVEARRGDKIWPLSPKE